MSLVWERAPYTAGSLLVLLALADWSNDEGVSWPSIPKIAAKTRLERRSIQYIIRQLKKDGSIEIEEGRGRGHQHRYTVNVQNLRLLPNLIKGEIDDIEKVQPESQKVQSTTEKVQPIAPDPSEEPLDQPSIEPSSGVVPFVGGEFCLALKDFEQHRKEIKKPLRATGLRLLYGQLKAMGEVAATKAMQTSIANGWQGVFPERNGNGSTQQRNGFESAAEKRGKQFNSHLAIIAELRGENSGDNRQVEGGESIAIKR